MCGVQPSTVLLKLMWYASFAPSPSATLGIGSVKVVRAAVISRLHALAPYLLGSSPELSLHFCVPTSELDNYAGDTPATVELDFASSAAVRVEVACAPRH